jgi:hypothetical protein
VLNWSYSGLLNHHFTPLLDNTLGLFEGWLIERKLGFAKEADDFWSTQAGTINNLTFNVTLKGIGSFPRPSGNSGGEDQ